MSLLSSIILPKLEKELLEMEPEIADFLMQQVKVLAGDVLVWAEAKIGMKQEKDA